MKSKSIYLMLILSISIAITSCTKSDNEPLKFNTSTSSKSVPVISKPTSSAVENPSHPNSKQPWGKTLVFNNVLQCCFPVPYDCYDDVVVHKNNAVEVTAYKKLDDAVASNSIKDYFTSNYWSVLFPGLDGTASLDSLRSGNYAMTSFFNPDKNTWYYLSGNVQPVTPENKDFVLQLQISIK